jgi:hypothetical protein
MADNRKLTLVFLVCGGALLAGPRLAWADVLYATGFEPPTFSVGPLAG